VTIVTKEFRGAFELVARHYELRKLGEYDAFRAIVRKMLEENFDFTTRWIADMAIGRYDPEEKMGVIPYTGGTALLKDGEKPSQPHTGGR
jgi:hypothetical protein